MMCSAVIRRSHPYTTGWTPTSKGVKELTVAEPFSIVYDWYIKAISLVPSTGRVTACLALAITVSAAGWNYVLTVIYTCQFHHPHFPMLMYHISCLCYKDSLKSNSGELCNTSLCSDDSRWFAVVKIALLCYFHCMLMALEDAEAMNIP